MTYLLDTSTFLWWVFEDMDKLSSNAQSAIQSSADVYISLASVWEIALKTSVGKLILKKPISKFFLEHTKKNMFGILEINFDDIIQSTQFDFHHKDPFDRILLAQAYLRNIVLISPDSLFKNYPTKLLW